MIEEKVYASVKKSFEVIFSELEKVIVGQKYVIENLMIALLCE
ncbi:MAG: AAA family ATPase, partial [Euryarchaeota archaeon]|nr:AAA family ATPase [Euryarchaeota archaeon]